MASLLLYSTARHVRHSSDKIANLSIYLIIYLSIYTLSALETDVISVHKMKKKERKKYAWGEGRVWSHLSSEKRWLVYYITYYNILHNFFIFM